MIVRRLTLTFLVSLLLTTIVFAKRESLPNVVVILADDMGYGELQCLNPDGKIKTPALDALAKEGMIFTDAHSGSSVCTPTRYGLMTGRYAWRTRLQGGVLKGGVSLISKQTLTLAEMLRSKGYDSVMIGKWHLGMMFDGVTNGKKGAVKVGAKVTHGPIDFGGFDAFYGFHYARQMDIWIENDVVTSKIEDVDMLPKLTEVAVNYIKEKKDSNKPFFMYIPWNSPHSPVVPSTEWKGKSGINNHADFVMQTDDCYGQVVTALKEAGKFENTLIICTSDNGTSPSTSGVNKLKAAGHNPSADFRGMKADVWEGGHRVPFIVSWKKVVKPGTQCSDLVCLTDIYRTVADIVGFSLSDADGVDSVSFLPALSGKTSGIAGSPRSSVIHHSIMGLFAIREKQYKLICTPGSGGWGQPKDASVLKKIGYDSPFVYQLYDMKADASEKENLVQKLPEETKRLRDLLQKQIDEGRSTPGAQQQNDVPIIVDKWKLLKKKKRSKQKT